MIGGGYQYKKNIYGIGGDRNTAEYVGLFLK